MTPASVVSRCRLCPLFLALIFGGIDETSSVHANGGGYFTKGVDQTGTIQSFQPEGTENVAIIQEDLDILLLEDSAKVEVRYILRNVSNAKARVRFGFPVEEIVMAKNTLTYWSAKNSGELMLPKQLEACRNYRIELGGKSLDAKFIPQESQPDERFIGLRGWLVSEARFDKGEEKSMTIRFEADHIASRHSVSEDSTYDAKIFKYRLSTGAAWHGPILRGRVTVRSEGLRQEELLVKSPVNRFQRNSEGWEWSFRDLEPTLEDDLVIQAVAPVSTYGWRELNGKFFRRDDDSLAAQFMRRGERWFVKHTNYSIKASSTLPNEDDTSYQAGNLRLHDAVWSEGAPGSGAGEWLELRPEVAQPLDAILIRSGHSEKDLFEINSRPCLIEIQLNGEHKFQHTLENLFRKEQEIRVEGYSKPVRLVKLTFLSVYEGTEHQDMCLTRVSLRSVLSKAPKVEPSR